MKGVIPMNQIRKIVDQLHKVMVVLGQIMLVLITILTCIQVFSRYVLNFSLRWSEEVPLIMMVWFGFIALALGVKKKLHISIELFFRMFPEPIQKILLKFVDLCILTFGVIMVVYGWQLAMVMMASTMPATKMPTGYLYIVVPISGVFVVFDSLMELLGLIENEEEGQDDEVIESLKSLSLGGKN
ncbi:MAG: TRAP transporter small permease [Firmicutes bacterium HGW-Firmicutes-3]|jgi:TRAP-type C4-dicarboxylate transport system permease small subunit|nr:MAG: TRAP transporter small permease [Firmicutes bacterium HGW-Firmicutes-3]